MPRSVGTPQKTAGDYDLKGERVKLRNVMRRRWRQWHMREDRAGRTTQAGYGGRDVGFLLRRIEQLRRQDPGTYDDLDRYILEEFGS